MSEIKCSNCKRWTKPKKDSACNIMNQEEPEYIPVNKFIPNLDGSFHCLDFKLTGAEDEF